MEKVKVRPQLVTILNSLGTIRQDGYHWLHEFKDERKRIRIVGRVRFEDGSTVYGQIFVELNLQLGEINPTQFLLKQQTKDWTVVEISEAGHYDHSSYQRPGNWINYITKLSDELESQQEKTRQLNHQPVDDARLFDDK